MKYVILGGVAAGTKAAAKLKRCDRTADVKVYTKGADISYAGCGLPYYIGGDIPNREGLIVNTPKRYSGLTGAEVFTGFEATGIDSASKTVSLKNGSGEAFTEAYDKLIIATGAVPFVPYVEGRELPGVFCVRTPDDAVAARAYIDEHKCQKAVVCGAGFIGLEVAENLMAQGLQVTVIDAAPQIMPNAFDEEMADYAKKQLRLAGMRILTSTSLTGIEGNGKAKKVVTDNGAFDADMVILAIGVRPATGFLADSGLEMFKGTILVDEHLQTNLPDIYAVGDCAMVKNAITGQGQWSAMGSTANLAARAMAKSINGEGTGYKGCLGTGVVRLLPTLNAGRTGLTEVQAKAAGYASISVICVLDDKAHYYPDASSFIIKLTAETTTGKLLGLQVFGAGAVDKMTDIAVVGISQGMGLSDFDTLDFAYAPPFSTAIHPFVTACYILENKLDGLFDTISPSDYAKGAAKGYTVLDIQPAASIPNARWIDLSTVNGPLDGLDKDAKLLLVCAKGKRGYFLQNRLKAFGYTNTKVLEGGAFFNEVKVPRDGRKLSAEEIKRVKGLGCLQDKRYGDVFNVRVITRNGKLTTDEQIKIAEAAEKFGSGEITMTTRLTLEIQGVNYDKLEPLFAFLKEAGLETGGTGSKVRPVVSCKGTTCQYGLIDTFALSEKLHELYYTGYHDVSLPHKFKIAVGGCPNNCVKPDLNDLGIIGQRQPEIDLSKCKGCKICKVQNSCPIKVAELTDGKLRIAQEKCNHCGRCIEQCPFGAVTEAMTGYKVYIGGRWGKKVAEGRALGRLFTSEEEVIGVVERAILFFRDEGISGERFADTIARLGFDYVQDKLLNSKLDKKQILEKNVVGGATC
ncbi:FAD-dependent oxidoreductase [Sporofaciens musculi]|uniref:FAD-dependent oxidoreductase n=1 Tax=Sporofaciens musculi TaxID=2681861 RepID=UPI0025A194AD|nr:FAD-dependent oxidoreductase [Sporofaciens musculi]